MRSSTAGFDERFNFLDDTGEGDQAAADAAPYRLINIGSRRQWALEIQKIHRANVRIVQLKRAVEGTRAGDFVKALPDTSIPLKLVEGGEKRRAGQERLALARQFLQMAQEAARCRVCDAQHGMRMRKRLGQASGILSYERSDANCQRVQCWKFSVGRSMFLSGRTVCDSPAGGRIGYLLRNVAGSFALSVSIRVIRG
jgi:hypothetical protein